MHPNSNIRNSYNMKKIKKFNNIDNMYNQDELKNLIIKPQKIEKPNINIKALVDNRDTVNKKDLEESTKKRVNQPYKGIIKDFDYSKIREKHEEDLIVHKVTEVDKDKKIFNEKMGSFQKEIAQQNKDIKDTYSLDKKTEHKKEFDYQHKYKYRVKIDSADNEDLRVDRIEFYKKEQNKVEENKKKIDDILLNLIDSGILSENMESINYDKIDAKELESKLKNVFGDEEFEKLLKDIEN
jgi:hypothetical protein